MSGDEPMKPSKNPLFHDLSDSRLNSRNLFLMSFVIFLVLFVIISTFFYCNERENIANKMRRLCFCLRRQGQSFATSFTKANRILIARTNLQPSSNLNSIMDEDHLNLAENQIFDDSLFADDYYYSSHQQNDGAARQLNVSSQKSNPYRSLTISS